MNLREQLFLAPNQIPLFWVSISGMVCSVMCLMRNRTYFKNRQIHNTWNLIGEHVLIHIIIKVVGGCALETLSRSVKVQIMTQSLASVHRFAYISIFTSLHFPCSSTGHSQTFPTQYQCTFFSHGCIFSDANLLPSFLQGFLFYIQCPCWLQMGFADLAGSACLQGIIQNQETNQQHLYITQKPSKVSTVIGDYI